MSSSLSRSPAIAAFLSICLAALGTACSRKPPAKPIAPATQNTSTAPPATPVRIPTAEQPPYELVQVGASAEELFDAAYATDWSAADEAVRSMSQAQGDLPTNLPQADLVAQLETYLHAVRAHVRSHERAATMDDANRITRLVTDVSDRYQEQVPNDVKLLGFYGRALEVGLAQHNTVALTKAAADVESTWNALRPTLEQRGKSDEVQRFTDIVVELDAAKRPADFVAPARAELAETDNLEKLFQS
jgi:hypothetical protein